jgi:hypothetical protein
LDPLAGLGRRSGDPGRLHCCNYDHGLRDGYDLRPILGNASQFSVWPSLPGLPVPGAGEERRCDTTT